MNHLKKCEHNREFLVCRSCVIEAVLQIAEAEREEIKTVQYD